MWQTIASAFHQLTSLAPAVAVLAAALYAANVLLCALRWRAALWALGNEVSVRTATLGMLCSVFVNNVTPARVAGDVFRVGWLKQREGIELGRGTASVAIDRLTDLAPIALIGLLSLSTLRPYLKQLGAPQTALDLKVDLCVSIRKIFTPFGFGRITHDGNYVTSVEEKPTFETEILAGIYVFSPGIFRLIPPDEYFGVDTLIKTMLAEKIPIGLYALTEYWLDIGQVPDYEKAQKDFELYFGDEAPKP